jgi:hypothetical protein
MPNSLQIRDKTRRMRSINHRPSEWSLATYLSLTLTITAEHLSFHFAWVKWPSHHRSIQRSRSEAGKRPWPLQISSAPVFGILMLRMTSMRRTLSLFLRLFAASEKWHHRYLIRCWSWELFQSIRRPWSNDP